MAIAGWITYSITNSDAMLLDGNFSFTATLSLSAAIMIIVLRHNKSGTYPFGNYFYESFFVFLRESDFKYNHSCTLSNNVSRRRMEIRFFALFRRFLYSGDYVPVLNENAPWCN